MRYLGIMRLPVAILIAALAGDARAEPFVHASTELGLARTDVQTSDAGDIRQTGLAARAAAVIVPAPHVELGLRLGVAYLSTDEVAVRRYANPVLDLALSRDVDRLRLRGGWSVALPLSDVREPIGTVAVGDGAALAAAARVWGPWDAWQWTPGWATVVAPLSASFAASDRLAVKAELTTGLSFSTAERLMEDDLTIWINQAALGGELDVGRGVWLGGRLVGVAIIAPEPHPMSFPFSDVYYGYHDETNGALELGGGIRFASFAVSALAAVAFDEPDSPGVSLGVATWR